MKWSVEYLITEINLSLKSPILPPLEGTHKAWLKERISLTHWSLIVCVVDLGYNSVVGRFTAIC